MARCDVRRPASRPAGPSGHWSPAGALHPQTAAYTVQSWQPAKHEVSDPTLPPIHASNRSQENRRPETRTDKKYNRKDQHSVRRRWGGRPRVARSDHMFPTADTCCSVGAGRGRYVGDLLAENMLSEVCIHGGHSHTREMKRRWGGGVERGAGGIGRKRAQSRVRARPDKHLTPP